MTRLLTTSDCCKYSAAATTQNQKQIEAPDAAKNQMFSPNRSYYMKKIVNKVKISDTTQMLAAQIF